jgi:hypothetical protein
MQPSELQVERSIAALRRDPKAVAGFPAALADLPFDLVEHIGARPAVRQDRVDAVRARLAEGAEPTAADVATKLVGRLVCDRLR